MNFSEYEQQRSLVELFDKKVIQRGVPGVEGKWVTHGSETKYWFNIPSNPERCHSQESPEGYCYYVAIDHYNDIASFSFAHVNTFYADRHGQAGKGSEVMYTVTKAIGEYIQKQKPERIGWTPVAGNGRNSQSRRDVYFAWAAKNLFPNVYVPLRMSLWIKADSDYIRQLKRFGGFSPRNYAPGRQEAQRFLNDLAPIQKQLHQEIVQQQTAPPQQTRGKKPEQPLFDFPVN